MHIQKIICVFSTSSLIEYSSLLFGKSGNSKYSTSVKLHPRVEEI